MIMQLPTMDQNSDILFFLDKCHQLSSWYRIETWLYAKPICLIHNKVSWTLIVSPSSTLRQPSIVIAFAATKVPMASRIINDVNSCDILVWKKNCVDHKLEPFFKHSMPTFQLTCCSFISLSIWFTLYWADIHSCLLTWARICAPWRNWWLLFHANVFLSFQICQRNISITSLFSTSPKSIKLKSVLF